VRMMRAVGLMTDRNEEERIVGALTPLLLDALRRNPSLVGYLTERDDDGEAAARTFAPSRPSSP
jgi:hypothetical protein